MGLDYSYELTCRRSDGPKLLAALLPSLAECGQTTEITWYGTCQTVPCSVNFESARITLDASDSVTLDTVIWLPYEPHADGTFADNPQRRQRLTLEGSPIDEIAQGYIYLTIECGLKSCRFTFAAPTSDTSRYFQDSAPLRSWFIELGRSVGCTSILFDDETFDETRLCVMKSARVPLPQLD